MTTDLPPDVKKEKEEKSKIMGGTAREKAQWRKNNVGETLEKLDEMGQRNEKKGIAAVQKAYREHQAENFRIKSDRIAWLNAKARYSTLKTDYYRAVDQILKYELSFLDLPFGYTVKSVVTDDGLKLVLKDRWGNFHIGGFRPSGLGLYDEQACRTSVNKLDDTISILEENPPSGIYLP